MKIPKIKSHTFYGKKYKIKFGFKNNTNKKEMQACADACGIKPEEILAMTDDRGTKNQTILISDTIEDDKTLLRVLLDEGLHACDERTDNDVVHEYATSLSNFLWRCGYRRVTPEKADEGLDT